MEVERKPTATAARRRFQPPGVNDSQFGPEGYNNSGSLKPYTVRDTCL